MLVRSIVAQGEPGGTSLAMELADAIEGKNIDRLDVAVAYATQQGLTALRDIVGEWPPVTRWVIGLDDAITQPLALDSLLQLAGAHLRLARLGPARRFHPKLYCFWASNEPATCVAAIGSANMTDHGLKLNGEITAILEAETEADAQLLKQAWEGLDALGLDVAQVDLVAYRELHKSARKARRRMARQSLVALHPEAEEGYDSALRVIEGAPTFWLDIGSAIGGRELELPKAALPFFDIPEGANEIFRDFVLPNDLVVTLRLIDRAGNDMWRLEFTADSIRAMCGRPNFRQLDGTRRSDLALHLQQVGDLFRARTVAIGGADYQSLEATSGNAGLLANTGGPNGRAFGFF